MGYVFVLSIPVLIISLLFIIPKKTRKIGKRISLFSLVIAVCFFAWFWKITTSPDSSLNNDIVVSSDITSSDNSTTNTTMDTPITKDQYQKIKVGMTADQVKKIVDEPEDNVDTLWFYKNEDSSSAIITFNDDTKIVEEKSEIGILSNNSETVTDKNGTKKTDILKSTNSDYVSYVKFAVQDAIGETVKWNHKNKDVVRKVEVNDNAGNQDGSKLILLQLNAPIETTNELIREKVNEQTLKIVKQIKEDSSIDFKIHSITFFWYLPLEDNYGNTKEDIAYKISLNNDTLKQINYDHMNDVDLQTIADQYNILFKE